MGNSCTSNKQCHTAGQCCAINGKCSFNKQCDLSDGRFDVGQTCSLHENCATGCCDIKRHECTYNQNRCPGASTGSQLYFAVAVVVLVLFIMTLIFISICIYRCRRRRKLKQMIDPRIAREFPIAEPIGRDELSNKIPVAKRLKNSQIKFQTERPPPIVENAMDGSKDFSDYYLAKELPEKENLTEGNEQYR